MVAIVVLLAAVIGTLALGFDDNLAEPAPMADFDTDYDPSGEGNDDNTPYLNLTFESGQTMDGDQVYVVDSDGNRVLWLDIWHGGPNVEPGQFVHVDGQGSDDALNEITEGEVYKVVWEGEGGQHIISEHEIETPPNPP